MFKKIIIELIELIYPNADLPTPSCIFVFNFNNCNAVLSHYFSNLLTF